jgi:hypothetical protein
MWRSANLEIASGGVWFNTTWERTGDDRILYAKASCRTTITLLAALATLKQNMTLATAKSQISWIEYINNILIWSKGYIFRTGKNDIFVLLVATDHSSTGSFKHVPMEGSDNRPVMIRTPARYGGIASGNKRSECGCERQNRSEFGLCVEMSNLADEWFAICHSRHLWLCGFSLRTMRGRKLQLLAAAAYIKNFCYTYLQEQTRREKLSELLVSSSELGVVIKLPRKILTTEFSL